MQELLSFLSSVHPLPADLREHLASILQKRNLKKKEILLDLGQVCRNIYFVQSGLFRCYYMEGTKKICNWFMQEGDTIASVGSFYSQKPSYESIQALETSVVYYISYEQLQFIYHSFPSFNFNGRVLTEKYYQLSEERNIVLRMNNLPDRYDHMVEHHGNLVNRVPRGDLATYLGVSQFTLSHMGRGD